MDNKTIFNVTVCVVGFIFLLIHSIDILLKKNRRRDENLLLSFVIFTALHLAVYAIFSLIKIEYPSNTLVIVFYTLFFIFNNVQLLLFFFYARRYIPLTKKSKDIATILNIVVFGTFIILDIVNAFTHIFFYAKDGVYTRTKMMFVAQGYQLVAFATVFFLSIFNKKLKVAEKIPFAIYCIIPFAAIVIQNAMPGYAIAYLSLIVSIEVLFLFIDVRKNLLLSEEAKKNKEAEVKLMVSQIQPHFIYNTLSSISTLIKIDPDKAQKGLDDFTEYLRANLSSLSRTGLIHFSDELRHIETYVSLEKMRFNERLNVTYDIKTKDFLVPPLSVQPIVENAVKHGILKKIEGGNLTIKTYEVKDANVVEIIDDGVGFDLNEVGKDGKQHIGISNVRYRLSTMCHSELSIKSEIGKGARVVVTFYK